MLPLFHYTKEARMHLVNTNNWRQKFCYENLELFPGFQNKKPGNIPHLTWEKNLEIFLG